MAKLNSAGSAFEYLTYLGGTDLDGGQAIAVDAADNAYVAGRTSSIDFPILNAIQAQYNGDPNEAQEAFVSKLNSDGSALVWSTFFGGSALEEIDGLALDSAGAIYFAGRTRSLDFPTQGGAQSTLGGANDAFVVKIADALALPLIRIMRSGSTVVITWPVTAVGFELEETKTLSSIPNWSPVTNAPVVVSNQNTATVEASEGTKFFRLKKP